MDLGFSFVTWSPHRGYVVCDTVWTGSMPMNRPSDMVSMPSSLVLDGPSQQPSKPTGTRGAKAPRAAGVTSRTALS